ncbi:MAG: tyrosine-type recombinase/integrase [Candidatus Rokubacteria bacterium]|nr:tyrosine-type recombinase/integrase [Candidatus Rokubacteria bacterium]
MDTSRSCESADNPFRRSERPRFAARSRSACESPCPCDRRARIRRALSIHSLRHTFGTLLYRATKDLVLVSRALGHRDVRSTQRYAHLDDRRLARAVNGLW